MLKGNAPVTMANKLTPSPNMSYSDGEYLIFKNASGLRKPGVPIEYTFFSLFSVAYPKSINFKLKFESSTKLSILISLL